MPSFVAPDGGTPSFVAIDGGTPSFVAIDFETADNGRDSACSVALAVVEAGRLVETVHRWIRPPRSRFLYTHIHGITWEQVADQPDFAQVWQEIAPLVEAAPFIAAHNAPFDRGVLEGGCHAAGVVPPAKSYLCTVRLAREVWNLRPTKLPDVCRHLGLALNHHDAISDANACAAIVLAAIQDGARLERWVRG